MTKSDVRTDQTFIVEVDFPFAWILLQTQVKFVHTRRLSEYSTGSSTHKKCSTIHEEKNL